MGMGSKFIDRTIGFRETILGLIEIDGFSVNYPSEYSWLNRQKTLARDGQLSKEHREILNMYLPKWDKVTSDMIYEARKIRLNELIESGNTNLADLINVCGVNGAYMLAKLGIDSVTSLLYMPCNMMFCFDGDSGGPGYFASYAYSRALGGNYYLVNTFKDSQFRAIKKMYPWLIKSNIAAYWLIDRPEVTGGIIGKNMYLFNFSSISVKASQYAGITLLESENQLSSLLNSGSPTLRFASRHREVLEELVDCFMNKSKFEDLTKRQDFKDMINSLKDFYRKQEMGKVRPVVDMDNDAKSSFVDNTKPRKTVEKKKGILGLMQMFSIKEPLTANDRYDKTLSNSRGSNFDGHVNPVSSGNESGDRGGHSFGEYLAAASVMGLLDNDSGGDGDYDGGGDFDD